LNKNIAVVGCGHWGKNLARVFFELGALVAISDPHSNAVNELAEKYSVKEMSFEDILDSEDIEGVVLAVPVPLHAQMAVAVVRAKKHVFVEKPLAFSEAEAKWVVEEAKLNGVKLMVGHLLSYHPLFLRACELARTELGRVGYINSRRLSLGQIRTEEDVMWSFGPHDISMILTLAEEDPVYVGVEGACLAQAGILDMATISMRFQSGLRADVSLSWLHPYKEQKLVVIGDKGMLVFDDTKPWPEKLALFSHSARVSGGRVTLVKADIEYQKLEELEPLKCECLDFLEVVNKDLNPRVGGEEGLRVVRTLSKASLAARQFTENRGGSK